MNSWLSFTFNITKEKTYSTSFVGCHYIIITFFLKNIKTSWMIFNVMFVFQVIGAFWYFFSIERETACWHKACKNQSGCGRSSFSCAHSGNYTFLDDLCPINAPNSTLFNFGIFLEALQSGVVQSSNLPTKFFFCFWWGLRNLRFACARLTIIIYWPGILIFVSLWSYYKMLLWSFLIYLTSRFLRLNLLFPQEVVLHRFLLYSHPS